MRPMSMRKSSGVSARVVRRMVRKIGAAALACLRLVPLDGLLSMRTFTKRCALMVGLATAVLAGDKLLGQTSFTAGTSYNAAASKSSVAMDDDGNYVVVWTQLYYGYDIYASIFDSLGNVTFGPFRVNANTNGNQFQPDVAMDSDGDFAVTWNSYNGTTQIHEVWCSTFDIGGNAISGDTLVSTFVQSVSPTKPTVAIDDNGDFFVAWNDEEYNSTYAANTKQIYVSRFDLAGNQWPTAAVIFGYFSSYVDQADVAIDPDGDMVALTYRYYDSYYGQSDVGVGFLDPTIPSVYPYYNPFVVNPFIVTTFTNGEQTNPAVAMDRDSRAVVVWETDNSVGGATDVIAGQKLDSDGSLIDGEFVITNSFFNVGSVGPAVAMDDDGDFVVSYVDTYTYPYGTFVHDNVSFFDFDFGLQDEQRFLGNNIPVVNGGVAIDDDGSTIVAEWDRYINYYDSSVEGVIITEIIEDIPFEDEPCASCCPPFDNAVVYAVSGTPTNPGTTLWSGKRTTPIDIVDLGDRMDGVTNGGLGSAFKMYQRSDPSGWSTSLESGVFGENIRDNFDMQIQLQGTHVAQIMTPDMRRYKAFYNINTGNWDLPEGFFSKLSFDFGGTWTMTHYAGSKFIFEDQGGGSVGGIARLKQVIDANGNTTTVNRFADGRKSTIVNDLGKAITFGYTSGRVTSITDHLNRTWTFQYSSNRLQFINYPVADTIVMPVGFLVHDGGGTQPDSVNSGATFQMNRSRKVELVYDSTFTNHIKQIKDDRGAIQFDITFDNQGRPATKTVNNGTMFYYYEGQSIPANHIPDFLTSGSFLPKLESTNKWTRTVDREGNICDYEIHGEEGNPLEGGHGRYGIRRKICWTNKGAYGITIHTESVNGTPAEPDYWEQRYYQDCNCLKPKEVSQTFRNDGGVSFDSVTQMPTNYPKEVFIYNTNRQIEEYQYKGFSGTTEIKWEADYQPSNPGAGQFARRTFYRPARHFDSHAVNSGLNFQHQYTYDTKGNMRFHIFPNVTRGVSQSGVDEEWQYNSFGQVIKHTDENGNVTDFEYAVANVGDPADINEPDGEFIGFLKKVTVGASGSSDAVVSLVTEYKRNSLGWVTKTIDPNANEYLTVYNNLGEVKERHDAQVTLPATGGSATYTTFFYYDGAGNMVLSSRENQDFNSSTLKASNPYINSSSSFDLVGNMLASRVEVDGTDGNDLITNYAYDDNDQMIATQAPEGNRSFTVYDERRIGFKTFYGIEPGSSITDGYPFGDKAAEDLGSTAFVGFTRSTRDARGNTIMARDGRGNLVYSFPDFYNRTLATSDQNGNGQRIEYDDESFVLTTEGGSVSTFTGSIITLRERSYRRYDERGRGYQTVMDFSLLGSESTLVNPDVDSDTPGYSTVFDPGSRVAQSIDANGNVTNYLYDSANRTDTVTDALNNRVEYVYDDNSNVLEIHEFEYLEGTFAGDEEYITEHVYDELNRRIRTAVKGLDGIHLGAAGAGHVTRYFYDSINYTRQVIDAEDDLGTASSGKVTQSDRDDLSRTIETRRISELTAGTVLILNRFVYDRNSRKTQDKAYTNASSATGEQITKYGYDNANRLVVTVYPDSDDTIAYPATGVAVGGNGPDGTFDRVEVAYDENSNITDVTEQRGVLFENIYDPGNRLTHQDITLATGVVGEKDRDFLYDELNRITEANNDYARVQRFYDDLSRLTDEVQWIRLDGKGFTQGWKHPITIHSDYDQQSNNDITDVLEGPLGSPVNTDLQVMRGFDQLNRHDTIDAAYFGGAMAQKAQYTFFGPWRVVQKDLGNSAVETHEFDAKRRMLSCVVKDTSMLTLTGFRYGTSQTNEANMGYDKVDNPLHEIWDHDNGFADNFNYNARYELTGVEWRSAMETDYRNNPGGYTTTFAYDSNFNRDNSINSAVFADPFGNDATVDGNYAITDANEYTSFGRSVNGGPTGNFMPAHDKAGNMTQIPLMPKKGVDAGIDVIGVASFDAFNRILKLKPGTIRDQHYRYDAFGRRIARFELKTFVLAQPQTFPATAGRGSSTAEEENRASEDGEARNRHSRGDGNPDSEEGEDDLSEAEDTSLASEESEALSGPVVVGPVVGTITVRPINSLQAGGCRYIWDGWSCIEEREFTAGTALSNGASKLEQVYVNGKDIDEPIVTAIDGNNDTILNPPGTTKNQVGATDFEYYFLSNRMGSIAALLDADDDQRILEYYRYSIYGEATVLPIVDISPVDGIEDTPFDLSDNNAQMLIERATNASAGRISKFRNTFMYTARRLDEKTGLYYYRYRYYEARMGRFVGRDPIGYADSMSLYGYCGGRTTWCRDPFGLKINAEYTDYEKGKGKIAAGGKSIKLSYSSKGACECCKWVQFLKVGVQWRVLVEVFDGKNWASALDKWGNVSLTASGITGNGGSPKQPNVMGPVAGPQQKVPDGAGTIVTDGETWYVDAAGQYDADGNPTNEAGYTESGGMGTKGCDAIDMTDDPNFGSTGLDLDDLKDKKIEELKGKIQGGFDPKKHRISIPEYKVTLSFVTYLVCNDAVKGKVSWSVEHLHKDDEVTTTYGGPTVDDKANAFDNAHQKALTDYEGGGRAGSK